MIRLIILPLTIALLIMINALPAVASNDKYEVEELALQSHGLNLNLSRVSSLNDGASKDILLIHGLTYSSHVFDVDYKDYSLVKFLARQGYNVWRLDLTGYGQSDKISDGLSVNSDYAAEDIKAAVDYIFERNGNKKIDLLGWSWGTVTTSRFVEKYPEKIRRLVLYAPIFSGVGIGEVEESYHKNTWEHAADDFQRDATGKIDFSVIEPGVEATFLSNCWRYDGNGSPNGGRKDLMVSENLQLIFVERLTLPVLIIEGDNDPYINRSMLKTAIAKCPAGSAFVEIAGGGHAMMIEKSHYKTFRKAVKTFLEN